MDINSIITAEEESRFEVPLELCYSMCTTKDGDIIITGAMDVKYEERPGEPFPVKVSSKDRIHWYNKDGKFKKKIPRFVSICSHSVEYYGLLEVKVEGVMYIAVSCEFCRSINLYNPASNGYITAIKSSELRPSKMCHAGQAEICAINTGK